MTGRAWPSLCWRQLQEASCQWEKNPCGWGLSAVA